MDQSTIRRVQLIQLEILKEVKRICNKLEINYWLDAGTFLGAVRHGGFIPWDDDLDVGMLREDYEKFQIKCQSELSSKYVLQNWDITEGYPYSFSKIRKRGTVYRELKDESLIENGIYIDIFPYDKYPLDKNKQFTQHYMVDILKRIILVKNGYKPWKTEEKKKDIKRWLGFLPIRAMTFISLKRAKNIYKSYQEKYNNLTNNYAYFIDGPARYSKWVIKKECLENLDMIKFEDDYFPCPSYRDIYLTTLYGDYLIPPPENERNKGHSIIEIDFGE